MKRIVLLLTAALVAVAVMGGTAPLSSSQDEGDKAGACTPFEHRAQGASRALQGALTSENPQAIAQAYDQGLDVVFDSFDPFECTQQVPQVASLAEELSDVYEDLGEELGLRPPPGDYWDDDIEDEG